MPPKIFLKEMIHLGKIIMGGPYTWLPSNMQYNYKSKCFFPCDISHIESLCSAIRLRTALCTYPLYNLHCRGLEQARQQMDANLSPYHKLWMDGASFNVLQQTVQHLNFPAFENVLYYSCFAFGARPALYMFICCCYKCYEILYNPPVIHHRTDSAHNPRQKRQSDIQ